MFSRYDSMKESKVLDTTDNQNWPDPLSVNYNNTQLTTMPKLRTLQSTDLDRFWVTALMFYKTVAEGDDVVLTLNAIPYRGMLEPGDEIYFPELTDLYNFGTYVKPGANPS
jgi:hypothetical protein